MGTSKNNTREISKAIQSEAVVNKVSNQHRSRRDNFRRDGSRFPQSNRNQSTTRSQFRSESRLNYAELGIKNFCLRCGCDNHLASECRVNQHKLHCKRCNRTGHVQRVCLKTRLKDKKKPASTNELSAQNSTDNNEVNTVDDVLEFSPTYDTFNCETVIDIYESKNTVQLDTRKFFATVIIEGKAQKFQVDSSAGYTLLPENHFNNLNIPVEIKPTMVRFRPYTVGIFHHTGVATVNVQ